uniref:RING-type domain-containing protein n=1 Tax=Branchiostoma floridae TaxID=7739 RepID=C3YU07_BRAFL|eukprot:XP_002600272.1 hypothetical protein BRAFLDRAFT_118274 [Branchiostoma floridae]
MAVLISTVTVVLIAALIGWILSLRRRDKEGRAVLEAALQEKEAFRSQLEELEVENKTMREEREESDRCSLEQVQCLQDKLEQTKRKAEQYGRELDGMAALSDELTLLKNQHQQLQDRITKQGRGVSAFRGISRVVTCDLLRDKASLGERLKVLSRTVDDREAELGNVRQELATFRATESERRRVLEEEISDFQDKLDRMFRDKKRLEGQVQHLKFELEEAKTSEQVLESQAENLRRELTKEKQQSTEEIHSRLKEANDSNERLTNYCLHLKRRIGRLNDRAKQAEQRHAESAQRCDELYRSSLSLQSHVDAHNDDAARVEELRAENERLADEVEKAMEWRLCSLCGVNERAVVTLPCLHFAMCRQCHGKLPGGGALTRPQCPYCKRGIKKTLDVYVV